MFSATIYPYLWGDALISRKGSEGTVWIIIVLVIALVVAVVLITVFSGTTGNVQQQTDPTISTGGSTMSSVTCKVLCDGCKLSSNPAGCYAKDSSCSGYPCV